MNQTVSHPVSHPVWARLAAFDHPGPARALAAFLEQQGFQVRFYDERKLQRWWFLARPLAGVCVQVPEEIVPEAREFLKERGKSYLQAAIHCPSCNSTRVQYPQMTRKNIMPTLVAHCLVALRLMRHQCYCDDCHYAWVRRSHTERPARGAKVPLFSSQR